MTFIIARLREPSTYAGLAALLAAFGISVPSDLFQSIATVLTGIAGVAAVVLAERKA
jgi:hypothetical protein